ncbi:hypothetical protein IMCC3317_27220 [Kordia antarctica]|uniref:Uncharacterized protein n=1 Tax=Kordia antarctica TaxID=1218801 RepID=A0A7L4ZKU4_9FLAO|nr:hypothetical protein [Kordia antarctica]QHI37343.1 hypothetical protein IMCC3317_27220 [Kordia antarctica]
MNTSAVNIIGNLNFDKKTINYLSVLKPAATAILLAPSKIELKDIIRYTLMDLALKKVLVIKKKHIQLHPSDPYKRTRTTVETAKNFNAYYKSEFEKYFLTIIDNASYFHLRSYLHRVYTDMPRDHVVKRQVIKEHKIQNLFSNSFIYSIFNVFRLNTSGRKVQNEIQRYLSAIDENIVQIIEESPEQALKLVSFLKGNIFLLKNLTFELLEKINALIIQNKNISRDTYFEMFDIFDFSEIFFTSLSEEITLLLDSIEIDFNSSDGGDFDIGDFID